MKKIGIVCAMKVEKLAIEEKMTAKTNETFYSIPFVIGNIGNIKCILVQSGVGKVHAARTTQILIDNFNVNAILNVGVGGSLSPELNIGDVVISKHVVQHDFDITSFNHKKGYIPDVGDYIECDKNLVRKFRNLIEEMNHNNFKTKIGIIASGDMFCTEEKHREKIHRKFDADIVDMECAAIAQVAYLDEVPFIGIRSVSDIPNGNNTSTFEENSQFASSRSAEILEKFCEQY